MLLVTVASACDCKGSSETIDPSDVRASDLYGWWTATDASGNQTVFGFVPREDATRVLPITPEEATADISAVYQGPRGSLDEPVQLATFEVKNGELLQTVLRDTNAASGTQLRTRIVSLKAQKELVLQSSSAASGNRSFSYSARCQSALPNGVFAVPGQLCQNYFSGATGLTVDPRGGVHAANGVIGKAAACSPTRPAVPTYVHFADACGPSQSPLPEFRSSSLAADENTLHLAYLSLSAYDSTKEGLLFYRYRPLNLSADWTEEPVAPQGYPVSELRLLLRDGQPLIVLSRTNGAIELYLRDAGTWTRLPALLTSGAPLGGLMADATLDRDGMLVLLLESSHKLAYERAGGFELIDLPKPLAAGFGGGVAVDASGRVHVAYDSIEIGSNDDGTGGRVINGRGFYGVYDGTAWTSYDIGPMAYPRIVTRDDGPWRVVHALDKATQPTLALTEVVRDGTLRSELFTLEPSLGGGNSPEFYFHPSAAAGREGTLAAAWDGNHVYIRPREDQLVREKTTLTVKLEGKGHGRVYSSDGTVDCTQTCSVSVPVGTRLQLFFEPDGQSAREAVPCISPYFTLYGYCWFDVFPGESQSVTAKFRESPVVSVQKVGATDGSTLVTRLAARGGRIGLAAIVTNGKLPIDSQVLDVGTSQQMLAVREPDGRLWSAPLPVLPEALGFSADGSAAALFVAYGELTFPSGKVGVPSKTTLVVAHYANGSFQRVETIVTLPLGSQFAAGALGDDDAVAAVFSNSGGFGEVGISDYNLFVHRNAAGTLTMLAVNYPGLTSYGTIVLESGRAAMALNNIYFTIFDGAAFARTQVLDGGSSGVSVLAPAGDRFLSLWSTLDGSMDLGGGPIARTSDNVFYAEYGLDGRYLSARQATAPPNVIAISPAPSGTIFAGASSRGGLTYGRLLDTSYSFAYAGDFAGNKSGVTLSANDGTHFWLLVRHEGTVDYDVATIDAPFQQVLLQMRLP